MDVVGACDEERHAGRVRAGRRYGDAVAGEAPAPAAGNAEEAAARRDEQRGVADARDLKGQRLDDGADGERVAARRTGERVAARFYRPRHDNERIVEDLDGGGAAVGVQRDALEPVEDGQCRRDGVADRAIKRPRAAWRLGRRVAVGHQLLLTAPTTAWRSAH